jgi:DNA repair protein RadC
VRTPSFSLPISARLSTEAKDSAPSLVPKVRRGRAKGIPAAPTLSAGTLGFAAHEQAVIDAALAILASRLRQPGACADSPQAAHVYALLCLANRDQECFAVMFLDAQNAVIAFDEMFRGTLMQTSVHPREIARAALLHNAASVIVVHNHPSGVTAPSESDKRLTRTVRAVLDLVDVKTLDHLIVAGDRVLSFAEHGLM